MKGLVDKMTNLVNSELQLVESQDVREQYIDRVEVLNEVKKLIMLSNDTHVTTEMVANYYQVGLEAINSLIKDNRKEVESDGLRVLSGEELKSFKDICQIDSRAKSLTIIPKRAVLRIGMLLKKSPIAQTIRTHLLNINQLSTPEQNKMSFKMMQEVNNNLLATSNTLSLLNSNMDKLFNQNKILNQKVVDLERTIINQGIALTGNVIEFNKDIIEMREKINELYDVLKIPENDRKAFSKLRYIFGDKFNIVNDVMQYVELYNALGNWFDITIVKTDKVCKRDFVINNQGIDMVREFITGIQLNRIIKNKNNNWVDLGGYKSNSVEWYRTKRQFNYECAYCGVIGFDLFPEHLLPQSHSKTSNEIWNIIPSCASCNKDKGNKTVMEWYPTKSFATDARKDKIANHVNAYLTKRIIV